MRIERDKANENPYQSPSSPAPPDDANRLQFESLDALTVIVIAIAIAAVWFALMTLSPWLGFIWLTTVGSAYAIRFGWRRQRSGAGEAIVGGSAGAVVGLLATLIYVYTSPEPWEDSGLGFWGCLIYFFPYAVVLGAIFGGFAWLVAIGGRAVFRH